MTTWYTADLHFGHVNISSYAGRPYGDVETMNADLVARINAHVAPDDDLVILGDVAMGRLDDTLPLVGLLHGRLTLIPGNHDRCWRGHGQKAEAWRLRYYDAGFDQILDGPPPMTLAGRHVQRSHFPYRGGGDHTRTERYSEHRLVDQGGWLLCGHVHEKWKQLGRQINVGIDAWGGRPVAEAELAQLMAAGPRALPADTWAPEG